MEHKQSNEEEKSRQQQQHCGSLPAARSQLPVPRKRLPSAASPPCGSDSSARKRTRDLPNVYDCHCCKFRVSNVGKDKLQPLASHWRIVLLCRKCLPRIESAELCSYCLLEAGTTGCFRCGDCSRRVHKDCVLQSRDVPPWSYCRRVSGFSVCVDCWVPNLLANGACRGGKGKIEGESCLERNSRVLENGSNCAQLEDTVKDANCIAEKKKADAARAREKALRKAVAAKRAVELANNALELVAKRDGGSGKGHLASGSDQAIDDAELAFQLHRAMNSSPRILGDLCLVNSSHFAASKVSESNNDLGLMRLSGSGSPSVCGKLEACTENMLYENPDRSVSEPSVHVLVSDHDSEVDLHKLKPGGVMDVRTSAMDIECKTKCGSEDNRLDVPFREGEGSCSNKLIISSGDDNSLDSESHSCQKQDGLQTNNQLQCGKDCITLKDERCCKPDRYLRKYSKRPIGFKSVPSYEAIQLKIQGLAAGLSLNCSKASRAFSDASLQSCAVPLQASACTNGSTRDQS